MKKVKLIIGLVIFALVSIMLGYYLISQNQKSDIVFSFENKNYFVATTDYLLDGGDKMYFLAESKETTIIDYKMRDVLIDYFIKIDTLKLKTDNRFIIN